VDYTNLSIVIPVGAKETKESVSSLMEWLGQFSGSEIILEYGGEMWEARRRGIDKVTKPLTFCLDVDTRVTSKYVVDAAKLIFSGEADAVATDYAPPYNQGHGAFGASVWNSRVLKDLYDYSTVKTLGYKEVSLGYFVNIFEKEKDICECKYMKDKLINSKRNYVELKDQAVHLK
jgi:hypothetical protein